MVRCRPSKKIVLLTWNDPTRNLLKKNLQLKKVSVNSRLKNI